MAAFWGTFASKKTFFSRDEICFSTARLVIPSNSDIFFAESFGFSFNSERILSDVFSELFLRTYRYFLRIPNMTIPVFKFIMLAKHQITEELFKKIRIHVNALIHVRIICTNQRITEIPAVFFKRFIVYFTCFTGSLWRMYESKSISNGFVFPLSVIILYHYSIRELKM